MGIYRNKRGNAWINVFVLLVFATVIATGLSFASGSAKIEAQISGLSALNEAYLEENNFEFYVQNLGERAIKNSYLNLKEDELLSLDIIFSNFQKSFEEYGLDKNYLKKENFVIKNSENLLTVKIENWGTEKEFKSKKTSVEILYRKDFNFEYNLKRQNI